MMRTDWGKILVLWSSMATVAVVTAGHLNGDVDSVAYLIIVLAVAVIAAELVGRES